MESASRYARVRAQGKLSADLHLEYLYSDQIGLQDLHETLPVYYYLGCFLVAGVYRHCREARPAVETGGGTAAYGPLRE